MPIRANALPLGGSNWRRKVAKKLLAATYFRPK